MNGKKEYGDFQTPVFFSDEICNFLLNNIGLNPTAIIEPTCGKGNFIKSSLMFNAKHIIGIEINEQYCNECRKSITDPRVEIINADFLTFDFSSTINNKEEILVLGNPPWVTNSTLSSINAVNIPQKSNFKKMKGMDALTGASNFDICEYICIKIMSSLCETNSTIALLCKTSVARNVFSEIERLRIPYKSFDIYNFNANDVFGINVAACLMVIRLSNSTESSNCCNVYSFNEPGIIKRKMIYNGGKLYSPIQNGEFDFSGKSCFEWRQGVKHDCSKVMELSFENGKLINGLRETVEIENDYIFPLIKSSMIKSAIISKTNRYVIVTQKSIREDTTHIKFDAPKTWKYLYSHKDSFEKRQSSIYKDAPEYSMFGIGNYSYSPYKVCVSGFYKKPLFSLLYSKNDHPIMTDDTCYFISFPTFDTAYIAMLILNSEQVQTYLKSISFLDSKRPFTKKVLNQIDFDKILEVIQNIDLKGVESQLGLEHLFTQKMLEEFVSLPEFRQTRLSLIAN